MQKLLMITAAGLGVALSLGGAALASSGKDGDPSRAGSKPVAVLTKPVSSVPTPVPKTYAVQPGDNLSAIAQSEQLDSWHPLWNANPQLTDPNLIYAGQQLVVPAGPTTDRPLPAGSVAPAPVAYSAPQQTYRQASSQANYAAGAGGLLARIRQRESGGNYADNTGNGYYGAYQFSLGTWRGVGGSGLPSDASPVEQDMRAQMLFDERGCSPWPNTCY